MADKVFDPAKEVVHIIDDIRHYFVENGSPDTKAVIGISGGKDSTIAATLLAMALGSDRVIGVLMPNGEQKDLADAYEVCKMLGLKSYTINIKYTVDSFIEDIERNTELLPNDRVYTNLPARVRMATLYNVAAMVGGRVINTGNKSEAYVGYTTKYGDLAGDYAILRDYYVTEIYQMGEVIKWQNEKGDICQIPEHLVRKKPADGMSGKTDEDNMGFTYEDLDAYLLNGCTPSADILHNITTRHNQNKHKEAINLPHPHAITRPYPTRHGGCFEDLNVFRF